MEDWLMEEIAWLAVIFFLGPYVVGVPVAIVWVGLALLVEKLTGFDKLLPADVRHAAESAKAR